MVGWLDELRAELINAGNHEGLLARKRRQLLVALAISCTLLACDIGAGTATRAPVSPAAGPVDSILPMDESIRRFRTDLPEVIRLSGGANSRDELVAAFVGAVERNDTAGIRRLQLSRSEYAYLYFPSSIYMKEPYRQPPAVAWFLNSENSDKGISRVLRRLGGRGIEFRGYACSTETAEGDNTFFRSCVIDYLDPEESAHVSRKLFGAIMARDGHYKFLSFANDF